MRNKDNNRKIDKITLVIIITFSIILIFILIPIVTKNIIDKNNFSDDEEVITEKLEYKIPKQFKKSEYGDYYKYDTNDINCSFEIENRNKLFSYKTLEEYLKDNIMVYLSNEVSDIKEIEINNIKLLYIVVKTKYSEEHYYGLEGTENYYMLKYTITDSKKGDRNDINTNLCYISKDKILNSIIIMK